MSSPLRISEDASLALHAMALLAGNGDRRLSASEIAEALGCSEHTLAKVLQRLVRKGLVQSARGPRGGFVVGGPAERIKLIEIYEAVEGPLCCPDCLLGTPICGDKGCPLGDIVHSIHRQVADFLAVTTLTAVAARVQVRV